MPELTYAPPPQDAAKAVAYLKAALLRRVRLQGTAVPALAETREPFNDTHWFWTDDNAKALELFALPAVHDQEPAVAEDLLDFVLAMGPPPFIFRRCAEPQLQVPEPDPTRFRVVNAFHEFTGDLSRGVILQAMRFNDGRSREAAAHTGNLVEFRHGGRRYCLDAEEAIVDFGLVRAPGQVILFHESLIRLPPSLLRRQPRPVAKLRYEYIIRDDSPLLRLRAVLRALEGIALSRVRLTTALDGMSRAAGQHIALGGADGLRPVDSLPAGLSLLAQGPVEHLAFREQGPSPGFAPALHVRLPDAPKLLSVKVRCDEPNRPHWVVARYRAERLAPGTELAVCEERLLTGGGYAHQLDAMARIMQRPEVLRGLDPSISYDHGAELNAVATWYLFAAAGRYAAPVSPERLARVREWYDRQLESFFATFSEHREGAVFVRGLAFVLLSIDSMLRAMGDARYEAHLAAGLDLLLGCQRSGDDDGIFVNSGDEGAFLDCQAAAILALARLVGPGCDGRIPPALRRAIAGLRLGTTEITVGGAVQRFDTPVVRCTSANGRWQEDGGFWSFKLGLLMRALHLAAARAEAGALMLGPHERGRLQSMLALCSSLLAQVTRERPEGIEFLTSPLAGETNSETQPWVTLGLIAPDGSLPDLRAGSPQQPAAALHTA